MLSISFAGKSQVARDYDVSRQWVHELVRRYRTEGAAAYVARSRRPHHNPCALATELEERIIEVRKTLSAPVCAGRSSVHICCVRAER